MNHWLPGAIFVGFPVLFILLSLAAKGLDAGLEWLGQKGEEQTGEIDGYSARAGDR